jgi:KUP system potassium uptake protein
MRSIQGGEVRSASARAGLRAHFPTLSLSASVPPHTGEGTKAEKADLTSTPTTSPPPPPLAVASLSALGIVFGDLGTSPLYTLQTVVQAMGGRFTGETALGILSLIVWTLIITVSIKYCLLVMRADNHGEGGILALMSLVGANSLSGRRRWLVAMGLLGAALIYGDGVITPAISVLSALEGVNVVTTTLKPFVMPVAVAILLGLFLVQRLGTASIGRAFGPIMLAWFAVIAVLGLSGIVRHPIVLSAINPVHAARFLIRHWAVGPIVLGGVFLCITGGEALYADMGHFGRRPIRLAWYFVVLPALLVSYAGQTGLLIEKGTIQGNPFFELAPSWSIYPLVVLSTVATIIASQAIITGSFSMTRQAMQLGWLPGVNIRQTSDEMYGQIYVPAVNWLMMVATVGITMAFRSSDHLAGAYGTAVSTTMMLTTCLLFEAMRRIWRWPLAVCFLVAGSLLAVDGAFFAANLLKIADGGWLPLSLGVLVFMVMTTWREGIDAVRASLEARREGEHDFLADLERGKIPRVPGTAVFLTRDQVGVPSSITEHIRTMGALHQSVICLTVLFEETPRVEPDKRALVEVIGAGISRVVLHFGFIEITDISAVLSNLEGLDPAVVLDKAIFFGTRDMVAPNGERHVLARWRVPIFAFLYRNAAKIVDRFNLPAPSVVEVAREIEI